MRAHGGRIGMTAGSANGVGWSELAEIQRWAEYEG
jgi:hypothetical protein